MTASIQEVHPIYDFALFLKDQNLTNEEALHEVTKSFRDFLLALEAFRSQSLPRH